MAESAPQANNVTLKFRRQAERERSMPPVSQLQNRAMQAAAAGKSTLGIPKKVGKEFTEELGEGDVKALPKRKNSRLDKMRAAGRISDKQARRFEKSEGK